MFYKIINLIKLNFLFKNKFIKTKLHKKEQTIVKIFIKLNIIKNVKKIKQNFFLIHINTENSFTNLKNLYKPSKPVNINLKNIIKINKKKTNIFYLSTNCGVINNFEAEKRRIGGRLIMNIWI